MLKDKIEELLLSTGREGMESLLHHMFVNGFYTAPCSSQYHLCKEEGLAIHSLNVFNTMFDMAAATNYLKPQIEDTEKKNSIIIVSLLHDLGKMGQYDKPNYVENILKSGKRSDSKPFETNKSLLPVPHEIRSIHIASQFIELTEEESFAVLYHNSLYGDLKYQINGKERPLQMLLHFSDLWCSRVVEE